jgi:superfamily I DNA and RNA helicase
MIEAEAARLVQITLDQRATLMGLLANKRVLVEGTAGSGKTLLALEFALELAAQGERALLLCFNKELATWLQEQAATDPRASALVEIATFHAYAMRVAHRAGVEFDTNAPGFWDDEAPLLLEQALDVLRATGSAPSFDAVIVDEAQDFAPDWWVTVEGLTKAGRAGRLYAFLDLHQSLRSEPQLPPVPLQAQFRLTTNCRNTRMIAQTATVLSRAKVSVLPSAPLGEPPALHRASSSSAGVGITLGLLRKLLGEGVRPRQIVLLGPAGHERGGLRETAAVDGVPLVDNAKAWRRGEGVLITTTRAFKGLEADVVILYDVASFGSLYSRSDLYVAWTRARHRLFVVCAPGEVRSVVEGALAAAPA